MPPYLFGVGVGPGDPELLTLKAAAVLRDADEVFAPTIALDAPGRAESIVRKAVPEISMRRLVFDVMGDDASRREAHLRAAAEVVASLDKGRTVAFVTLGDPNIYSTFHHLASYVIDSVGDVEVRTVPGIMAFQDLASRAGTIVLDATERLHLVSAAAGTEVLDHPLADPEAAIVVYKGGRHVPEIARRLDGAGRLKGAVLGELLGMPGERVIPLADASDEPAPYLASVLVPPRRHDEEKDGR